MTRHQTSKCNLAVDQCEDCTAAEHAEYVTPHPVCGPCSIGEHDLCFGCTSCGHCLTAAAR